MKNSKTYPKSNSNNIIRIDGYAEEWIDKEDVDKVINIKKVNDKIYFRNQEIRICFIKCEGELLWIELKR